MKTKIILGRRPEPEGRSNLDKAIFLDCLNDAVFTGIFALKEYGLDSDLLVVKKNTEDVTEVS